MSAASRFRKEAERRYGNTRHRTRYPDQLKALALEHLDTVLASGGAVTDAAQQLGIDPNSLRLWRRSARQKQADRPQPKARRMRVVADNQAPGFVVIGPSDVRVECADAQSVADLLRALR